MYNVHTAKLLLVRDFVFYLQVWIELQAERGSYPMTTKIVNLQ